MRDANVPPLTKEDIASEAKQHAPPACLAVKLVTDTLFLKQIEQLDKLPKAQQRAMLDGVLGQIHH